MSHQQDARRCKRVGRGVPRRSGWWRAGMMVGAVALVASACGGSGAKKNSATQSTEPTTSTSAPGDVGSAPTTALSVPESTTIGTTPVGKTATTTKTTVRATANNVVPKVTSGTKTSVAPVAQVTGPTPTVATGPQPQPGGSVTFIGPNELATFDPTANSNVSGTLAGGRELPALFDVLVSADPVTLSIHSGTADAMTSSDGVVWTVKLHPGIKFTDGTPYDANAVKLNWQRHGDPANGSQALSVVQAMQSMDVVDGLTLRVTLKAPDGQWPRTVARRLSLIASPASIQAGTAATNPVGAGPFMMKEFVRDDHLTLVRNPGYWNAPKPYLDQVVFKIITDDSQAYDTLNSGQGDLMQTNIITTADKAAKAGIGVNAVVPNGGRSIMFNESKGAPYNDIRFRKAVALAIDYDLLNKQLNNGLSPSAKTFFEPTSPFYDPSITLPGTDKVQAQQLFNQVAADNGGQVKFTITGDQTSGKPQMEALQAQLNSYDKVKVDLNIVTTNQAIAAVTGGTYTVSLWSLIVFDPEPNLYPQFRTGNVRDYTKYSNPDMDKALDLGHSALDQATRVSAYKTVQQLIARDTPEIYLWRSPIYNLYRSNVQNVETYEDGIVRLDQVWLKR